jgi:hypothetical protein
LRLLLGYSFLGLLCSASWASPAQNDKRPRAETSLEIQLGASVAIRIGKGKEAKETSAIVDLNTNNAVILSHADAHRLDVRGSTVGSFDSHDKSVREGSFAASYATELLGTERQTIFYWPRIKPKYDEPTKIGPEALGVDFLHVTLGPPRGDEVIFGLKLIRFSNIYKGWNAETGTLARIGDQTVSVMFDPSRDESYTLGTVGRRIAVTFGGFYTGQPEIPPESNRHAEDPEYRIRKMTFGTPAVLGSLAIDSLFILNSNGPDGKIIPERERMDDEDPAFTIIVDAMKKEPRHRSYPTMVIGRDHLSHCSSIAYDFAKELIYLSCSPPDLANPVQLSPVGAYFPAKAE